MHAQASQSDILTEHAKRSLTEAITQVNGLVLGKPREIRLAFATLLAGGHLLVEDLPGLGKTTLARAMAATLGLQFQRMQFTSDLLPSDIIGVSIFDAGAREFRFHPGPVFTQMLLADEINRAPPRTQSALLEAMAERQVTVDGQARALPHPFFVMATQNPVDLAGTFPLPDSQLDRFMLRISLGYPDASAEKAMLAGEDRRSLIESAPVRLSGAELQALQAEAARIHASDKLVAYVHALLSQSRRHPGVRVGLSPRAGLALLAGARALALLSGRGHALPEDVQAIFVEVAAHRLVPEAEANTREQLAKGIQLAVAVD